MSDKRNPGAWPYGNAINTTLAQTFWQNNWANWNGSEYVMKDSKWSLYFCTCVGRSCGGGCPDSRSLARPNWDYFLRGISWYSHGHDGHLYVYASFNQQGMWNDFNTEFGCGTENVPALTFPSIPNKQVISPPFQLSITSPSSNPISIVSNNTSRATINGQTVTIIGVGEVIITATQISNCNNSSTASRSFLIYGITRAPDASSINYGQSLSSSILSNGTANLAGTFTWTNPNIVPNAGRDSYSVTFTPTDTNFGPFTTNASINVNKISPIILTNPLPSPIICGQTLSASNLVGGSANVPGVFSWANPGTVPAAGTFNYSVIFTPTDTSNYSPVTFNIPFTIDKLNQIISFNLPEEINVSLGNFTLSASSSSNLSVSFSVTDTSVANINGNILIPKKVGPVTVVASQNGNGCYNPAPSVSRTTILNNTICGSLDFLDCQVGLNKGIEMTNAQNMKEIVVATNPPYCMEGNVNLNSFSSLEKFICRFNALTGLQGYANKPLKELNISNNYIKSSLEPMSSSSLEYFNARHNRLTGSIFDFSNKTNLKYFNISNNNLTGYIGNTIPPTLTGFFAADNNLRSSAVTRILSGFQNMVLNNNISNGYIYLDGVGNQPPDLDGLLYSGFLAARGWKVKCNPNIFNNPNSPIISTTFGATNTTLTNLNLRSLFPGTYTTPQQVYVKIQGNIGSSSLKTNNDPSIRVGTWPAGTKILLENVGPVAGGTSCNPTNGVIAGRGGSTCGTQGANFYSVTDAIWVDSAVQLLILNNGIIGGGGAVGADGGGQCGEGGGGAGIPAGQVGAGNGSLLPGQPGYDPNKCCGGGLESAGTILCGGGVASSNGSAPGGNLGSNSAPRGDNNSLAGFAIKLTAGASYSFVPWSSNPSFAGDARVGSL